MARGVCGQTALMVPVAYSCHPLNVEGITASEISVQVAEL